MTQPKIVMYVQENCSDVDLARAVLENRGLEWQEIDIERDLAAHEDVIAWTGGRAATPIIWIGETMLVEPSARELSAALDEAL